MAALIVLVACLPDGDRPAGELRPAVLAEGLSTQALELAARFDARNGNAFQSGRIRELLAQEPLVAQLPLTPPPPHHVASTVARQFSSVSPIIPV